MASLSNFQTHPFSVRLSERATDEFDNERVLATLERMFTSAPRISLVVVQTSSGEPPSSRPDNEGLGGPDVIWVDHTSNQIIGFELKTEKGPTSSYNVDDVSKGHSYVEWIRQNYDQKLLGLIFVGPKSSVTQRATPSEEMYICELAELSSVAADFHRFLHDTWGYTPSNRVGPIKRAEREAYGLGPLFRRLSQTQLRSLPVIR
jgi:hypothetical protein